MPCEHLFHILCELRALEIPRLFGSAENSTHNRVCHPGFGQMRGAPSKTANFRFLLKIWRPKYVYGNQKSDMEATAWENGFVPEVQGLPSDQLDQRFGGRYHH